jgi:flagellar protein FlaG
MNVQPLGSPTTPQLDERTAGAADPSAVSGAAAAKSSAAPAAASAKAAPSRTEVDAAVKKLNDSMSVSSQSLEFSVDQDSKQIVVKLIDQSTKEVLRQIPSVEALQMAKAIDETLDKKQGLLLDQTA